MSRYVFYFCIAIFGRWAYSNIRNIAEECRLRVSPVWATDVLGDVSLLLRFLHFAAVCAYNISCLGYLVASPEAHLGKPVIRCSVPLSFLHHRLFPVWTVGIQTFYLDLSITMCYSVYKSRAFASEDNWSPRPCTQLLVFPYIWIDINYIKERAT